MNYVDSQFGGLAASWPASKPAQPIRLQPRAFTIASGPAGLNAVREEWLALLAGRPGANHLQSPRWFASYLEALAPKPEWVHFIAARSAEVLDAVFVLEARSHRFAGLSLPSLRLITGEHMHLSDLAVRPGNDELWAAFSAWLGQQRELPWQVLSAEGVCVDSTLARLLGAGAPRLRSIVRPQSPTAWLDCSRGVDHALQRVSRSHRGNVRRLTRRARELGSLTYEAATDAHQLGPALEEFFEVEASGWKGEVGSAIKLDARVRAFYRELALQFGETRSCRINLLRLDGRVIAGQFGLISNQQLNLLKIGYSQQHAHIAPGHLIMQHTIESVCADPTLARLSFVTNPPWAHLWKPETTPANCHRIYRNSLMGRGLRWATQQWIERPQWARRSEPTAAGPSPA